MSSLGKTINLYLMDGSEAGRWQATLSNWNGAGYKIPHSEIKNCSDLPELNTPGVYFLFGKDDESGKPFIYVGEADDVQKRLLQPHTFEKDGSYWTEAVIFVTPDGTLEKGRVKYLENRFYTIAANTKRYLVKNGNTPTQSQLPKSVRDLLEEFIIDVELVLPVLGYMAFVPMPSATNSSTTQNNDLLYFSRNKGKGGKATGIVKSDGFWVLKGAYIYPNMSSYYSPGLKALRNKYASLIDVNGILTDDICFGSPSYAAAFVCGKSSNGLLEWKDKNGVPLKVLDNNNTASAVPATPSASTGSSATAAASASAGSSAAVTPSASPSTAAAGAVGEVLQLSGKKVAAKGQITGNGFTVLKGSGFSPTETNSCQDYIRSARKKLLNEGKVQGGVFTQDVYFQSPSTAAACVLGASANGNIMWLYPDGKSIKEKAGN